MTDVIAQSQPLFCLMKRSAQAHADVQLPASCCVLGGQAQAHTHGHLQPISDSEWAVGPMVQACPACCLLLHMHDWLDAGGFGGSVLRLDRMLPLWEDVLIGSAVV